MSIGAVILLVLLLTRTGRRLIADCIIAIGAAFILAMVLVA